MDETSPAPMGRKRAARQAKLEQWQRDRIASAQSRIADWRVPEPLPIRVAGIGKRLGEYRGPKEGIILAPRTWAAGAAECKSVILHELVHAHVRAAVDAGAMKRESSHGPTFRKLALVLGLRAWGDKTWRWRYTCPTCGRWRKTHRKVSPLPRCPADGARMQERDLIPLDRAERARIAGKPLPEAVPGPVEDPRAAKLAHARAMLATWERKQATAERRVAAWKRKVRARERACSGSVRDDHGDAVALDGADVPLLEENARGSVP